MAGKRKKKKSFSNFLGMTAIAVVVLLLLAVMSIQTNTMREKDQHYAQLEKERQAEYDNLVEKGEELKEESIRVQTRQYIEEMARTRLGLVKPDNEEIIFRPQ